MDLRDGCRLAASAGDHRASSRSCQRGRRRRRSGEPPLRRRRNCGPRVQRVALLPFLGLDRFGPTAVPGASPRCDRPDERVLPGSTRRARARPAPAARIQDLARDPRAHAWPQDRGGPVHVRRAARRREQSFAARGARLPPAARRSPRRRLYRPPLTVRGRRTLGDPGQHAAHLPSHGGGGALLRGLGDSGDAGVDAVELRAGREVGVQGSGPGTAVESVARPSSSSSTTSRLS